MSEGRAAYRPKFKQADLTRAMKAAAAAGVRDYRIDIAPDGTISIVVGAKASASDRFNSWDDILR